MEIIISVIGLVVYWYLSNLGKDKKKTPPNNIINNENIVPPRSSEEGFEQAPREQRSAPSEPSSFSELLGMLSDNVAFEEHKKASNPFDPERAERQLEEDLEEYKPKSMISNRTYNDGYQWKDDYARDNKPTSIVSKKTKKTRKRKKSNTAKLFKSPSRIRDAFVMNEILQKKYE
ncbi:hypothetical protein MY04_1000 [Flammeovirga sp. MY04]|uniref:hypothetical protein n=1 Tax=Flammeovirga sp. MY04 TaxID=1191459 RepID=UPI0008061F4F|nr:hypothetical protein [Flammeovirga sp. MY04]ANQ48382.1 hypothetical protein MY04_1000 [Flammeovirga sp. MY04]